MPRLALFVLVCAKRPVPGVRVSVLDLGLFGEARVDEDAMLLVTSHYLAIVTTYKDENGCV